MQDKKQEKDDVYIIPPNFIEEGTFMGGMLKFRNAVEAGVLVAAIGIPIIKLPLDLTTKIIVLCLTALPAGIFGLIGISGECLSSFIYNFFRYLYRKRVVGDSLNITVQNTYTERLKTDGIEDEEFTDIKKEKPRRKRADKEKEKHKPGLRDTSMKSLLPIVKIEQGVVFTRDYRFVKILEVTPINFMLRSAQEQRNLIYSYISYLKISPIKVQLKVLSKKADINKHLQKVKLEIEEESDEKCRELQRDYMQLIKHIGSKEAITRRFFLVFEHERNGRRDNEADAIAGLRTAAMSAKSYLLQCGNEVLEPEFDDEFINGVLYDLLNRKTSTQKPFSDRVNEIVGKYVVSGDKENLQNIPVIEFFAPDTIDFTHGRYIKMDNTYYSYLIIPSGGYKPRVYAGWLSLLINAGEGIDVDVFLSKEPKDRIMMKLGQRIRINRSKIKDASDTNTDFDDLESAIQSGYYLKDGLANNEDFYYLSTLITITADSVKELDWRIAEMKKMLVSQDMDCAVCTFRQEAAFLSSLPLASMDKALYSRAKRNVLTTGVASCYPFLAYEISDDNGMFVGVNKHNGSMAIMDFFDSSVYKNANFAICGSTGAGKTYTLQLIATRARRKGIQCYIIVPAKGHEFRRASDNVGGSFAAISAGSLACINVMEIRKKDTTYSDILDGIKKHGSILAEKIQHLHVFFSLLVPDANYEETQLLDNALIETYRLKGITHDNDSLYASGKDGQYKEMPILEDLYNVLIQDADTKRMANIINRFVHGSAASFNRQTNVNLDNKYIVLDISQLTGDMLLVGMFIVLDFVWDQVQADRTTEKFIFLPELWKLIGSGSNKMVANYVLEIFKTIRGYGGGAVADTQDLSDFFALDEGKYGRGILNACKTKIILNMEEDEARIVQSSLNLSEAEVMAITHFPRGSGLVIANNNHVVIDFKASKLENQLITTDRRELQQLVSERMS